ncbi:hypothetical protein IFVP5_C270269 [Vibrio parahaemolyticus]
MCRAWGYLGKYVTLREAKNKKRAYRKVRPFRSCVRNFV